MFLSVLFSRFRGILSTHPFLKRAVPPFDHGQPRWPWPAERLLIGRH
jgi:hypothetical protein